MEINIGINKRKENQTYAVVYILRTSAIRQLHTLNVLLELFAI